MTFESQLGCCDWGFILTNPTDAQRLVKLMNYTGVYDVKNLNGKIVRTVMHDCFFRGFGDPIEDKFIPAFGERHEESLERKSHNFLSGGPEGFWNRSKLLFLRRLRDVCLSYGTVPQKYERICERHFKQMGSKT